MNQEQKINELFNILIQFEKISEPNSNVSEMTYKGYLDKLYVWYVGYGNLEIATYIEGLYKLGASAKHETVKRSVFNMISILNEELRKRNES